MPIFVFGDLDVLRAALDSGLVPADVQAAPVEVAVDDDGRIVLESGEALARADRKQLREAGVEFRRGRVRSGHTLSCWAEVLPSEVAPEPELPLGEVLFLSEGDAGFLQLSGELLRLGCEDQRLAFFEDAGGQRRNLCRVPEPPYYAILRALERDDPLRAFVPARPGARVWIELGASHPRATRLEGEPGQLVLIPRPHPPTQPGPRSPWLRVPDGPWVDLPTVSDVTLPKLTNWTPSPPARRLEVELRLVRAPLKRPPDLWVLRERALEQIEELVRTVPSSIVTGLRFATVEVPDPVRGGTQTLVVLRARRSAKGPPALHLDAEAYVPSPQIPDLYLPLGTTIDPPLRPSQLRELLIADEQRIMWLAPGGEEGRRGRPFARESLAESAFAPLSEWVDYLVGAAEQRLEPWLRSAMFELDSFISIGVEWEDGVAPTRDKNRPDVGRQARPTVAPAPAPEFELPEFDAQLEPIAELPAARAELAPLELPRSAAERRLAELEAEFCALETPLDDPARLPIWAELGNLQAALLRSREAGLCWSRALWEPAAQGPSRLSLARRWVESESGMLGYPDGAQMLGIVDVVESDLDEQMVRALAAEVIFVELFTHAATAASGAERQSGRGASAEVPPSLGGEMLARLQRFFVSHGALLDLRTLWLARSALARLAGDDRLALFQTRDAIMSAMREGVGLARNVPAFVRTQGNDGDASDLARLADELVAVQEVYHSTPRNRSTIESTYATAQTDAYVELIFAWGLARVGRAQPARELVEAARERLGRAVDPSTGDVIHLAVFASYQARVEQALEGLAPGAPFSAGPAGPIAARERLGDLQRFKYDRLVQLSRILDPRQDVDAFDRWTRKNDEPFAGLALLTNPEALAELFDRILTSLEGLGPDARARELGVLLEYLEALPEPLALPRLRAALGFLGTTPLLARTRLLRNAMALAGYYDRADLVAEVLAAVVASDTELTEALPGEHAELLTRCAPILRRNGHEARLGALLAKLEERVGADAEVGGALAQLHIAAGFAALGQPERIQSAVNAALALLPELAGTPSAYQPLLREIAVTLSRSTPGQAIAGARALLEFLPNTTDSMSTNSHFCLAVLQLMEAVVIALASEDLVLSEWARRWVEEDEHLLHRRIHRDLAAR